MQCEIAAPWVHDEQSYRPVDDYAVIGNCRTAALVSRTGSIDWLCLPHFSAPSVFAALLDHARGGRLAVSARDIVQAKRAYLPDTNVLQTRFECRGGTVQVTDFMSIDDPQAHRTILEPEHELIRIIECLEGEAVIEVLYQPRPDYGRHVPHLHRRGRLGWSCTHRGLIAFLGGDVDLEPCGEGAVGARLRLAAGDRRHLLFSYCENDVAVVNPVVEADRKLQTTVRWWRSWCEICEYSGPHRDHVLRSALTLKLLDYALSGAVIAAATTSLPEGHTGDRNWDYRYCWLRDTSLVLQSFLDLGYAHEAARFLDWLLHATALTQPHLQVLYDVFGETRVTEHELPHLEGYRTLGPVRIGNQAHAQSQHDIYGDVIVTAYDFVDRGGYLSRSERRLLKGFAPVVREIWRKPDHSIWEVRTPPRHNTYSKLMCWTALDRLARLEERLGLGLDADALRLERDEIRADIDKNGYDEALNSYVGYYGSRAPDASLLLMARYGYIDADDPRMIGTYRYIERELGVDGLLFRYPPGEAYDGVPGDENLFGICSFWLVDYLARLGETEKAERLFDKLLACANDLGLFAEQMDVTTKRPVGNFPQGFSHVGLITAALALEQARQGKRGREIAG